MKRFPFLPVAAIVALMVTIVSCGMPMNTQGGYYEDAPTARSRYYNNNVIIVERDPFTGQYYQVSPYDTYATTPYGYSTPYPYDSRYYNNSRNRNTTYYPRNRQAEQPRQQPQYKATPKERDDAKTRVLGSKNN